jgi:hypothetical protein
VDRLIAMRHPLRLSALPESCASAG